MARTTRQSVDIHLSKKERDALRAFNKGVSYNALFYSDVNRSRIAAVAEMRGDEIRDLAAAFRYIHPQWFTNGRGDLADGTISDCRLVIKDVLNKLNPRENFISLAQLFDLSGDNAIPTGRRPLAHVSGDSRVKRTRTRVSRTHCKYHPDREVSAGELCSQCNSRWNSLQYKDVYLMNYPEDAIREIMQHPRPKRNKPLYAVALEAMGKYEKLEGNTDANAAAQ